MSRKASLATGRPLTTVGVTPSVSDGDICPVCKTLRYLNKDLEFLINPECYHPMCSGCVNRLFENGPNQCPYAGCHKTLRRKGFKAAYFGDLAVEREVDIRRRVAAVFNQTEDDFESLDAYNEYLEMVESLTFDLVNGSDAARRRAEAQLAQWEAEHKADIERNRRAGERQQEMSRRQLAAEREGARQRRAELMRLEEEERQRLARQREADLDSLAEAPEGAAGRVILKKRGQHRREELAASVETAAALRAAAAGGTGISIRGLKEKKKAAPAADEPYDPFGGLDLAPSRYVLRDSYPNNWLEGAKKQSDHTVPGYSVQEYYARSMFEAFAGLGVFIEDEKETGQVGVSARSVAATEGAMAATQDVPVRLEADIQA
ncbi:CDK-activating kinase assembly factor MAT1 [Pleurostoma richardsiae]|uniref:RNA polymerase II transcription factor B subunit 3 n=1 Tax=Pleurostoma richardsiae TaxID=41990 RepID=A0AA38RB57_9PEZI|nr:CDK-activating kinase assembly factor MAT1 [Pleurostoma richardsiae]